jgi:catechol 2,3-dioxygenase-like lactoylglutathione lyase family enzyme
MTIGDSLVLGPMDQIELSCADLDDAKQFYSGALRLTLAGHVPGMMKAR